MMKNVLKAIFRIAVPERYKSHVYTLYWYLREPSVIRPDLARKRWMKSSYRPFDNKCRENFFLSATSFLWTNRDDRLKNGYYLEFGSFGAVTMRMAWRHTRHFFNLTYIAFDSFEGLPEIDKIDEQPIWQKGRLAMSEPDFRGVALSEGLPKDRLITVKGFYDLTLTRDLQRQFLPLKASIIYIDCDLYKSTVPVLKFIVPFLQVGTVIAFDDWNCFWADPNRGQRLAWREFVAEHPELHFESFVSTHGLMSFVSTGPTRGCAELS